MSRKDYPQNPRLSPAFTLVEAIVTVAIFSLIAYGIIALVSGILVGSSREERLLTGSDQARRVAGNLMRELRNATISSIGGYALAQASPLQLVFYSNIDTDPDRERLNYYVQNGKLYRGVIKPSGNPLAYNPASEQVVVVQNDVANGAEPLFKYYDGSYDGVTDNPLGEPVALTEVKFVKMNLLIINRGGVSGLNTFRVTAGGAIRNLKTNLGD